jgi:hypothetical protein
MAVREQYEYEPLPGPNYIRLLKLERRTNPEDDWYGTLETHRLDEDVAPYTTLSYSWGRNSDGDSSRNHEILIEHRSLPITESLFDALQRIRRKTDDAIEHDLFWIDAICIDQSNIPERNQQVSIVARIFKSAASGTIWLGDDHAGDTDQQAYSAFRAFGYAAEDMNDLDSSDPETLVGSFVNICRRNAMQPGIRPPIPQEVKSLPSEQALQICTEAFRLFRELEALFSRRYFFRLWVVQERYHSIGKPCTLRWGSYAKNISETHDILMNVGLCQYVFKALLVELSREAEVAELWEDSAWPNPAFSTAGQLFDLSSTLRTRDDSDQDAVVAWATFFHVQFSFRASACSDPRDRLYALVSLLEGWVDIRPDYCLSVEDVYIDYAKVLIQNGWLGKVLIDSAVQVGRCSPAQRKDLPSWVPDLRLTYSLDKTISLSQQMTAFSTEGTRLDLDVATLDLDCFPEVIRTRTHWVVRSSTTSEDCMAVIIDTSVPPTPSLLILVYPLAVGASEYEIVGFCTTTSRIDNRWLDLFATCVNENKQWQSISIV